MNAVGGFGIYIPIMVIYLFLNDSLLINIIIKDYFMTSTMLSNTEIN